MKNYQLLNGFLVAGAVSVLVSQPAIAQVTQVTGVELKPTPNGLQVILQTNSDKSPQIITSKYNQTLLIDIFNTQLNLPDGEQFSTNNPSQGITSVTINRLYNNSVRVTVVGSTTLPKAEVVLNPQATVSAPTTPETTQQPTPIPSTTPEASAPETSSPTDNAPESAQAPTTSMEQPESEATPEPEQEELEIVVTGQREGGYVVENSTTATRTETPLRDIPQSIQVIPRQVIEEQQVTRIGEALRNVSGVTVLQGYGGSNDNFAIRGFQIDNTLRNGFREDYINRFTDPANIERIEVLKGPASVLYGQFEPGGIVNYVTKKPLRNPYYAGEFTIGSYDFYRPSIDLSGPLNSDKSLLYRLNLAYENAGSFRDFVNNDLFLAAPVFTYQIGDNTKLTLEYEYSRLNRTFDRGFLPDKTFFELPISRFLGEPNDSYELTSNKPSYVLEHRFNDNLSIRNAFAAYMIDAKRSNAQPRLALRPDGRTLNRRFTETDETSRDYTLQTDLIGKFRTGSIQHEGLLGIEFSRSIFKYTFLAAPFTPIDIFNPVYGSPKPTEFDLSAENRVSDTVGIYFQDQVTLLPNLKLLAGGRVDFIEFRNDTGSNTENASFTAFSPRIGIVYQPIQPISLYASYSRSFEPDLFSKTVSGDFLEPEKGTQYEVGMKAELFGGRLSTTLAAYSLTKKNIATTDPNDPNGEFSIAAGEVKSEGIELDVIGRILPGWNITASYGFNDARVIADENIPVGDRLVNAPAHNASLWTTYEIQKGNLRGLGFGAGVFFVGDREAQLPNTIEIPSYVRTDAAIFYRRDNYKIGLNIRNLFDKKYYDSQGTFLYPGAPLTVLGTISVQF